MSDVPTDLFYTKDHEWVRLQDDGTAIVGITAYAQESLGDITFVEFPECGETIEQGETFGVVESVKAASDLYMPVTAEVIEINDAVDLSPELVNQDPYGKGWLLKIRFEDSEAIEGLLKPEAYSDII